MDPIVTMAGTFVISTSRATIVWSTFTIWEETTIGSTPPQGTAPWVCTPVTVIRIRSAAAIMGPERYWAVPNNPGQA